MRRYFWLAVAALIGASPVVACTGESVHLEGDFSTGSLGWGEVDEQFTLSGGEAVLTAKPGKQNARWNAGVSLSDLDACVTIAMPEAASDPSRTYAGLLFWLEDKNNFYEAVIAPNGLFAVARKIRGKIVPTSPVPWTKVKGLKVGPNDKNTLGVTLDGQMVTVTVNGTQVARFRGQPPSQPNHVGLVAASGPDSADSWRMTDFKVTNVPAAKSVAADADANKATTADASQSQCADGKVLFVDDFEKHDPAWGAKNSRLRIASGEAVVSPAPGTRTFRWNRAFVFDDLIACATVRLNKNTSDPTASYAGLMFWVEDNRNYYQAVVAPSGYFTIARVVDGKVKRSRPVDWTKTDVVKTGAKKENTLRVALKGENAEISINGEQVASFKGEPPHEPSYIGLLAASAPSKNGDDWSITDFMVAAPQ